jgi:hypothetical protein
MNRTTRSRSSLVLAAGLLACLACSSSKSDDVAPAGTGATTAATEPAGFEFSTGPFEIQPGDTFECFYTATTTDQVMNVQNATGTQGKGGHHLLVYYADQKQPVGHHKCSDVEMIALHQIAAAEDGNEGIVALPDGYATKVPAGKQLVVQSHYIRTEDGPLTVNDSIKLKVVEDKDVKQFANSFTMVDMKFQVPARGPATSSKVCTTPQDLDLLLMIGHMHEWGAHYKLERVDENDKPVETLYETEWEQLYVSHPPVTYYDANKPLHLPRGTRLRQTCSWKNTDDQEKTFPREMCVMFSYYVPDNGFLLCDLEEVKQ